jgi:hypothetical protein
MTDLAVNVLIADPAEQAIFAAAAREVATWASRALGRPLVIQFRHGPVFVPTAEVPQVALISLAGAIADRQPLAETEARWQRELPEIVDRTGGATFLCTVFRHVPREEAGAEATLSHIRRLNLLAIELSRVTGAGVIDIDRAFAHIGARRLRTDWRLGGEAATRAAAEVIASALFAEGLDAVLPADVLDRIREKRGGFTAMVARMVGAHGRS